MSIVTLPTAGTYTIGNSTVDNLTITSVVDDGTTTIKTLENGVWKSWTKGAPDAFQAFNTLKSGVGYVVTTEAQSLIDFGNRALLNIMSIPANVGANMLAVPYFMPAGANSKFSALSFKLLDNQAWKSWTVGAPDAFQGFTTLEPFMGYYADLDIIYQESAETDLLPMLLAMGSVASYAYPELLGTIDDGLRLAIGIQKDNSK